MGKGKQAIELRQHAGILLYLGDEVCCMMNQCIEDTLLNHDEFIFSVQDFLFVYFKLLRNVAFPIYECLLTNPIRRNFVLVRITYLKVVAKDFIIRYFQRIDRSPFDFPLLNLNKIVFS